MGGDGDLINRANGGNGLTALGGGGGSGGGGAGVIGFGAGAQFGGTDGVGGSFAGGSSGSGGDAVFGDTFSSGGSGFAGNFNGNLNVSGAITAATKDFKIDHPLDPANKYLVHASVESSEMKNIYDGVVTTDAQGEASAVAGVVRSSKSSTPTSAIS